MPRKPATARAAAAPPRAAKADKPTAEDRLRAWLRANRVRLAPVHLAASMPVDGWVLHLADDGWKTALAAGAVGVAWAGAWGWAGGAGRFRRALPPARDRWMALSGATTATGLVTAMAAGGGPDFGANPYWGLIAAWGGMYGTWWWRRHGRAPEQGELVPLADQILIWEQHIAKPGGAMTGSTLTEPQAVPGNGWTAIALAPPGDIAKADPVRIASAFDTSPALIDIETFAHRPRRARIRIMDHNPLQAGSVFPGPQVLDIDTGRAVIGSYTDGDPAGYQFFYDGNGGSGVVHSFIVGTTGSGKSRLLDELLTIERHNGIISWVCDPQGGQSLPDWTEAVDWFAPTAEDGYHQLLAAQRVVEERSARYARLKWTDGKGRTRRGKPSYHPADPDMDPLLSITLEEAPALMKLPGAADIAADIGKRGRKCGVKLRLVAQVPNLDELGGKAALRAMLQSGNIVLLRTDSSSSNRLALGGALDSIEPSGISKYWPDGTPTGGLGYISGPDGRSGQFRTSYLDDPYDYASTGDTPRLEGGSRGAAGAAYAEADARMRAHLDGVEWHGATTAPQAATPAPAAAVPTVAAAQSSPAGTAERIVAFLAEAGRPVTRAVIARKLGLTGPQAGMALKRAKGKKPPAVVSLGNGAWVHADHADQYSEAA